MIHGRWESCRHTIPLVHNKEPGILTYTAGENPKEVIIKAIGDALELMSPPYNNRVIVATAPHISATAGGILFTDRRKDEGRYQGKVGLILSIGPTAFRYDGSYEWEGDKPQIGDWVFYRPTESVEFGLNGVPCRVIKDEYIIGGVLDPEVVY